MYSCKLVSESHLCIQSKKTVAGKVPVCICRSSSFQLTRSKLIALCKLQLLHCSLAHCDSCMQDSKLEACASGVLLILVAVFNSLLSAEVLGCLLLAFWCWNLLSIGPAARQVKFLYLICCSVYSMRCICVVMDMASASCWHVSLCLRGMQFINSQHALSESVPIFPSCC